MLLWTLKWIYFFKLQFFLDICAGVGLLDHKVILFSVFWGTYTLFCIVAAPTYISTNSVGKFPFLHTLSSMCRLLNDGHSDWCEVVPHCSFDLHFSDNEVLSIFSCACRPSICLLWRNVYLGLLPIFWKAQIKTTVTEVFPSSPRFE